MKRLLIVVILAFSTSACMSTFHTKPYVMYSDTSRPLSDTVVFSTAGFVGNANGQILSVDGKETSCWEAGCPIWVRVAPGDHKFKIRLSIYDGVSSYRQGEAEFTAIGMKPRHVYEAQFRVEGNRFHVSEKDLGENPEYGMTLGLKGVNQKFFRVVFE